MSSTGNEVDLTTSTTIIMAQQDLIDQLTSFCDRFAAASDLEWIEDRDSASLSIADEYRKFIKEA